MYWDWIWKKTASAEKNNDSDVDQKVMDLIKDREEARKAKDFAKSDEIRDQLKDMGIEIKDTADGTKWKKV